jgi:hypothetical protein
VLASRSEELFARLSEIPVLTPTRGSIIRPFVERLFVTHGIGAVPIRIETVSDCFGRLRQAERCEAGRSYSTNPGGNFCQVMPLRPIS